MLNTEYDIYSEAYLDIIARLNLTTDYIRKATGASIDTIEKKWNTGKKHAPETARRLILCAYGGVKIEEYLK